MNNNTQKVFNRRSLWFASKLNIDFDKEKFNIEQFRMGLDVELEHGTKNMETNVTNDDPIMTAKIALAHLREFPDYYNRLKMEEEANLLGREKRDGLK